MTNKRRPHDAEHVLFSVMCQMSAGSMLEETSELSVLGVQKVNKASFIKENYL